MKLVTFFQFVFFVIIGGLLFACGGGGDDGALPPPRPTGDIVGTAFDGLIINGDVRAYDWSSGTKGQLLGTAKTNSKGQYGLAIKTPDKPVLIEIDGGFYIEEATGKQIQVIRAKGYKLMAVQNYTSGNPITVSATFFTTVATGLAEYLVQQQGMTVHSAILSANQQVSAWAGFDIQTVTPLDVTDPHNATSIPSAAHQYGLIAAAISEFTRQVHVDAELEEHSRWPSIEFIQRAYDDVVADGVLDGKGRNGRLSIGNTNFTGDTYRSKLATTMQQFVLGQRNKTSLTFNDVMPFALAINTYQEQLFDFLPPVDNVKTLAPRIVNLTPYDGGTMAGKYNARVVVEEVFGLKTVEFFVNNKLINHLGSPADTVQVIDTYGLKNGSYKIKAITTNILDNTSTQTVNVTVRNGLPRVTQTNITKPQNNKCFYHFDITDGNGNTGLSSVSLYSAPTGTISLGSWGAPPVSDATVNTELPISSQGDVPISVTVSTLSGNSRSYNYTVAQSGGLFGTSRCVFK